MVFIEYKSNYFKNIENDTPAYHFIEFLYSSILSNNSNQTTEFKILQSLIQNNVLLIQDEYIDFSNREPNSDTPYLYKDLLFFLFVCASVKFKLRNDWILRFMKLRKNVDIETELITTTIINILNNSLYNISNCKELVIVYEEIIGLPHNEEFLNETFKVLTTKTFPVYNKQFLNIIVIKSIDIIIYRKGLFDFTELEFLQNFSNVFLLRTKQLGTALLLLIDMLAFSFFFIVTYKLFFGTKSEMENADKIFTAFSIIGLSALLGLIIKHKSIVNSFQICINNIFGFKNTSLE